MSLITSLLWNVLKGIAITMGILLLGLMILKKANAQPLVTIDSGNSVTSDARLRVRALADYYGQPHIVLLDRFDADVLECMQYMYEYREVLLKEEEELRALSAELKTKKHYDRKLDYAWRVEITRLVIERYTLPYTARSKCEQEWLLKHPRMEYNELTYKFTIIPD